MGVAGGDGGDVPVVLFRLGLPSRTRTAGRVAREDAPFRHATSHSSQETTTPRPAPEPTPRPTSGGCSTSEPLVEESNPAPTSPPEEYLKHDVPEREAEATRVDELEPSDKSTKWVSRSSTPSGESTLVVNPDSTIVTDAFPSRRVNFVTILGPARSGKSLLMNALARKDGVFRVSPAAEPCTVGADLSNTVVSLEEFTGTATAGQSESMPFVGFVDVEGLGDKDPSHHVKMAIPPMLVSKIIIFNLKDVQRTTVLDTLAVLESAAKAVTRAESKKVYGHLIVVVRDTFDQADDIKDLILGEEESDDDASTADDDALELRNRTRRKLQKVFQEITVWCLPQPHPDINENKHFALSDLSRKFHAKLDELRKYVGEVLKSPHTFGRREIIGGVTLQPLMTTLCEAVSTCKDVKPLSMMKSIEMQVADSFSNSGVERFECMLEIFDVVDVYSVGGMEEKIGKARGTILAEFEDATKDLQEGVVKDAKGALLRRMDGQSSAFRTTMETYRIKLNESVRLLNETAFTLAEHEASAIQLPVDDLAALWRDLCDRAFADLQGTVADVLPCVDLLPYVPTVLDREAFEGAIQAEYKRIEALNSLEKRVNHAEMRRKEADEVKPKMKKRAADKREEFQRQMKAKEEEHRTEIAKLADKLTDVQNGALRMSKSFYEQRQQQKKAHQEQQEQHQQEQQRTAWEMICLKLEQRVERLNKGAFALIERQASSIRLPVEDPVTVWSDLCDDAFSDLQGTIAQVVPDKRVLARVPSVLSRVAFGTTLQDAYKRFERSNKLEQRVNRAEMERKEADERIRQMAASAAEERAALERKIVTQDADHRKRLEDLKEAYEARQQDSHSSLQQRQVVRTLRVDESYGYPQQCPPQQCLPQQCLPQQGLSQLTSQAPAPAMHVAETRASPSFSSLDGGGRARVPSNPWNAWQQANAGRSFTNSAARSQAYRSEKHHYC